LAPAVLCAHHPSAFASPLEVLRVWEGGLTLLGGIAGGVAAGLPLVIQSRLPVLRVLDTAAPGLALGIAVGRLGDLAIADHLGRPTNFRLGFRCPAVAVVGQTLGSPCPPGTVVHLTAAYDLLDALLVFGLLTWLRRRPGRDGRLALTSALAYGLVRVAEGFTRNDKQVTLDSTAASSSPG
jgi:phosphatidylglycerol---prolipoprotein diacylglyceryl transferase